MGPELLAYPIFERSLLTSQIILDTFGCGWKPAGELGTKILLKALLMSSRQTAARAAGRRY